MLICGSKNVKEVSNKKFIQLKGHTNKVNSANFSNKDGSQVVTASVDKTARIYNESGEEICVLKGHTSRVRHAVFSPNDK